MRHRRLKGQPGLLQDRPPPFADRIPVLQSDPARISPAPHLISGSTRNRGAGWESWSGGGGCTILAGEGLKLTTLTNCNICGFTPLLKTTQGWARQPPYYGKGCCGRAGKSTVIVIVIGPTYKFWLFWCGKQNDRPLCSYLGNAFQFYFK